MPNNIFVDGLTNWKGKEWCHLYVYPVIGNEDKLHSFAQSLGLKRSYFHESKRMPHYDLTPFMRGKAIRNGAIAVSRQELVAHIKQYRLSLKPPTQKSYGKCRKCGGGIAIPGLDASLCAEFCGWVPAKISVQDLAEKPLAKRGALSAQKTRKTRLK